MDDQSWTLEVHFIGFIGKSTGLDGRTRSLAGQNKASVIHSFTLDYTFTETPDFC
jgi:hypothetical protein